MSDTPTTRQALLTGFAGMLGLGPSTTVCGCSLSERQRGCLETSLQMPKLNRSRLGPHHSINQ